MYKGVQNIFAGDFYSGKSDMIFIREFNPGDLGRVYEIECRSFEDPYHPLFLMNLHEAYHDTFLVALENERAVGYAISRVVNLSGHIIAIAVDPENRTGGIGNALMGATIKRLKDFGVKNVWLEVRISNYGAIDFYKKLGFAEGGIIRAYYLDLEDAIILKRLI